MRKAPSALDLGLLPWEVGGRGLSPSDVLPATFLLPGSLRFIEAGSKHISRVCLQMAGVHAGPQWA